MGVASDGRGGGALGDFTGTRGERKPGEDQRYIRYRKRELQKKRSATFSTGAKQFLCSVLPSYTDFC
jgi:hypothetical protein